MSDGVHVLTAFDDRDGAALYAAGAFTTAMDSADAFLAKHATFTSVTPLPPPGAGGIRK